MINHVAITILSATDYAARLRIEMEGPPGTLSGTLRGPRCTGYSTLPAVFALQPTSAAHIAEVEILEPCYWKAEQPFVYDINVHVIDATGQPHEWTTTMALKPKR